MRFKNNHSYAAVTKSLMVSPYIMQAAIRLKAITLFRPLLNGWGVRSKGNDCGALLRWKSKHCTTTIVGDFGILNRSLTA
jgi:hypothetical protein